MKKEKRKKIFKKFLFSFILIAFVGMSYLYTAEIFLKNFDNEVSKNMRLNTLLPNITNLDIGYDIVDINGEKSPSVSMEFKTDRPTKIRLELKSDDFFKVITNKKYEKDYNYDLILPTKLVGKELSMNIEVLDHLERKAIHKESYKIPVFNNPKVSLS